MERAEAATLEGVSNSVDMLSDGVEVVVVMVDGCGDESCSVELAMC